MNPALESNKVTSDVTDLSRLNGRIVLVRSAHDHRNPPTAMRGWLEVHQTDVGSGVSVAVEFPQMFGSRAHHRTLPLDETSLARLLASERNGIFEFTIDDDLT